MRLRLVFRADLYTGVITADPQVKAIQSPK